MSANRALHSRESTFRPATEIASASACAVETELRDVPGTFIAPPSPIEPAINERFAAAYWRAKHIPHHVTDFIKIF